MCKTRSISLLLPQIFTAIISRKDLILGALLNLLLLRLIKSALASVQHRRLARTFQLRTRRNGPVASEAFPHINHAAFTLTVSVFQLLALRR